MTARFEGPGWEPVSTGEPEDGPPPPPEKIALADYLPLGERADLARVGLALATAVTVVAIVFDAFHYVLLGSGAPGEVDASEERVRTITYVQLAATVLTAGFFLAWFHRAYRNLGALGIRGTRWGAGWAIGGWFVPILALFLPKQIANDVWRASDPELPTVPEGWRGGRVPFFLTAWWLAYVFGGVLGVLSDSTDSTDRFSRETAGVLVAADTLTAIAGVLAIAVVERTTVRQQGRAALVATDPPPDPRTAPWLRAPRALAAAAGAVALAAGVGLLTVALQPASPASAPDAAASPGSPRPFVYREDFSDRGGGWFETDDASATFAHLDGAYRMVTKNPGDTWYSTYDFGVVLEDLTLEVDVTMRTSSPDDAFGLGCSAGSLTYDFAVWTDGFHAILRSAEGAELSVLAEGSGAPVRGRGETNRLRVECRGGAPGRLVMFLNGERLLETDHRQGAGRYTGMTLSVASGEGGGTADFDDLVVEGSGR